MKSRISGAATLANPPTPPSKHFPSITSAVSVTPVNVAGDPGTVRALPLSPKQSEPAGLLAHTNSALF